MKKHLWILLVGSAVCLYYVMRATSSRIVGGDATGAITNTANILEALQWLGTYVVFSVVVLGHGLFAQPARAGGAESPG
jgi:hypothetical protein